MKVRVKVVQSYLTLCDPMDCPWNSPGQNTGVDSLSVLQGIFSTQGSNPGLPHCRQILYQLSHKGSGPFLKSLLNLVQYCFCFMFLFFVHEACEILVPYPGTKPTPCALDSSLNHWTPGKSQVLWFK